jgi:hypothetical protein
MEMYNWMHCTIIRVFAIGHLTVLFNSEPSALQWFNLFKAVKFLAAG